MNAEEKRLFIAAKLTKAEGIVSEMNTLLQFDFLETLTNRCYYCCFYCAQALLAAKDLYPKSHRGVVSLFNLHYAKPEIFPSPLASFLQEIFAQRQLVDYADAHEISDEMAGHFLQNTQRFFEATKSLLQTNE